jgi:hypothetical protein
MESFMARRFRPSSTPRENFHIFFLSIPWKLLVILPIILIIAIPTFFYGEHAGGNIIPALSGMFYSLSNVSNAPTPTPMPAFPKLLPQVGTIQYAVRDGDNCDQILSDQMHMYSASEVFSDSNANTVKQLNKDIGVDCHLLQPGMLLKLSPQYPLVTVGGVLLKIAATSAHQVLPTPLIKVQSTADYAPDCSNGCSLTVRLTPKVTIHLNVQTSLSLHLGSWIWAQAMMPRKAIAGFKNYPYADPNANFNGMTMRACDFQVNDTHDDNSVSCSEIDPNTIDTDGGSWLLGVVGANSLNHWHINVNAPIGTQVMLWLADKDGTLKYQHGDPVYRYDESSHLYVKL